MKRTDQSSRVRLTLLNFFWGCVMMAGVAGCWTDKSGTHHMVILGVGVVSMNDSNAAATVTSTRALGVVAGPGGVTAGYATSFITAVPAGAEDVRIEASQRPLAPIRIEVQKAQLNQTNQINQGVK